MLQIEADQEAVLTSLGEELDAACRILAKNEEKLQVCAVYLLFPFNVVLNVRLQILILRISSFWFYIPGIVEPFTLPKGI